MPKNSANLQSSGQNNSNEQRNKRKNKGYKRKLSSFVWEYFGEIKQNVKSATFLASTFPLQA